MVNTCAMKWWCWRMEVNTCATRVGSIDMDSGGGLDAPNLGCSLPCPTPRSAAKIVRTRSQSVNCSCTQCKENVLLGARLLRFTWLKSDRNCSEPHLMGFAGVAYNCDQGTRYPRDRLLFVYISGIFVACCHLDSTDGRKIVDRSSSGDFGDPIPSGCLDRALHEWPATGVASMHVQFKCLQDGLRYYRVMRDSLEIFVGTRDECDRFLTIHFAKVEQERLDGLKTPRSKPVLIRSYRAIRAQA